ncbi:MAG: amino acid permease, partial [Acidithiobacillus sp.]
MASVGQLRREGGKFGLLYASLGAIVGSGWLFGPLHAAQTAGPLSLFSWLIGALAILLLALVYAELGPLIPRSGAIVHISHLGNGSLLGWIWGWILFFSYVIIAPVEVTAVLTYA